MLELVKLLEHTVVFPDHELAFDIFHIVWLTYMCKLNSKTGSMNETNLNLTFMHAHHMCTNRATLKLASKSAVVHVCSILEK